MSTSSSECSTARPWRFGPGWCLTALAAGFGALALAGWLAGRTWGGFGPIFTQLGPLAALTCATMAIAVTGSLRVVLARRPTWQAPIARVWRAIARTAALLVVAALVTEVYERTIKEPLPDLTPTRTMVLGGDSMFAADAELGWVGVPNAELSGQQVGRQLTWRHNSGGFRDIEHAAEGSDRPRILVLGDSVARGWGVTREETFTSILQDRLPDHEVINQANVSYGLDQILLAYRRHGRPLRPDLVVVEQMQVHNEVSQPVRNGVAKPWCLLRDGRLEWHGIPVPTEPMDTADLIAYQADADYHRVTSPSEAWQNLWRLLTERSGLIRSIERTRYGPLLTGRSHDRVQPEAIALLRELRHDVEADGGRLIVLAVPPGDYARPGFTSRMAPVVEALRSTGVEVIDLARLVGDRVAEFFTTGASPHPNAAGHVLMADAVIDAAGLHQPVTGSR